MGLHLETKDSSLKIRFHCQSLWIDSSCHSTPVRANQLPFLAEVLGVNLGVVTFTYFNFIYLGLINAFNVLISAGIQCFHHCRTFPSPPKSSLLIASKNTTREVFLSGIYLSSMIVFQYCPQLYHFKKLFNLAENNKVQQENCFDLGRKLLLVLLETRSGLHSESIWLPSLLSHSFSSGS